jgi:hypothetical protein
MAAQTYATMGEIARPEFRSEEIGRLLGQLDALTQRWGRIADHLCGSVPTQDVRGGSGLSVVSNGLLSEWADRLRTLDTVTSEQINRVERELGL